MKITAEEGGTVQVLLVGGAGEGMMSLTDIAIPVSYTHLDVYKRQVFSK